VDSNYLEHNTGAVQIGNGDGEVADGAALTSHDRPDDTYVTSNVLVNNERNIFMTGRDKGLGARRTTVAHNIIQGGQPAAVIDGPFMDPIWRDNAIWQTTGGGSMPPLGFVERARPFRAPKPLKENDLLKLIRSR